MKLVTRDLLARLSEEARSSLRLRKNHNLHPSNESHCHRLLNAIEPGSYIRPHRHLDPEKGEAMVLMSGRLGIVLFSEEGEIRETVLLSRENGVLAIDIPSGTYHAAVSLEPGTVFFEAKAGPYLPLSEDEAAAWAPAEEDDARSAYLEGLRRCF
ncbi:WbuC family cupin fold metalloprotein [Holophaga foetida]|uniref:WbuC family cupin fold metalloprotein n=1 Tax=Holophaga foetida TaxID=35839 RepID=UPI0002472AE5|nr:WbuC family cupin fold metalloprotein [Holophaga foetida]